MRLFNLVAAASASPVLWFTKTWWNEAVDLYNGAVENPQDFASIASNVDDDDVEPLFYFCAGNDELIDGEELTICATKIADYGGLRDSAKSYIYRFGEKYWDVVDSNGSGDLNFEEFKIGITAFAETNTRAIIKTIDNDGDGMLTDRTQGGRSELDELDDYFKFLGRSWDKLRTFFSEKSHGRAITRAWLDSQLDDNPDTFLAAEFERFQFKGANILLGQLYDS